MPKLAMTGNEPSQNSGPPARSWESLWEDTEKPLPEVPDSLSQFKSALIASTRIVRDKNGAGTLGSVLYGSEKLSAEQDADVARRLRLIYSRLDSFIAELKRRGASGQASPHWRVKLEEMKSAGPSSRNRLRIILCPVSTGTSVTLPSIYSPSGSPVSIVVETASHDLGNSVFLDRWTRDVLTKSHRPRLSISRLNPFKAPTKVAYSWTWATKERTPHEVVSRHFDTTAFLHPIRLGQVAQHRTFSKSSILVEFRSVAD